MFFFFCFLFIIIGFIGLHLLRKYAFENNNAKLTFQFFLIVPTIILILGLIAVWTDNMSTISKMRDFYATGGGAYSEMYSPTTGKFIGVQEYNKNLSIFITNRTSPFRFWYTPDVSDLHYIREDSWKKTN